jgi:hypothetical protein
MFRLRCFSFFLSQFSFNRNHGKLHIISLDVVGAIKQYISYMKFIFCIFDVGIEISIASMGKLLAFMIAMMVRKKSESYF